jgi:hypothetical protein
MINHVWAFSPIPDREWQEIRGEEETVLHMYLNSRINPAAILAEYYISTTQVLGYYTEDR